MLLKFNSLNLTLLGVFCMMACTAPDAPKVSNTLQLADGVLTLEILPGSFATNECGISDADIEASEYACVAFPISSKFVDGKNWDADYLRALGNDGWEWAGGEGNAYYLEKEATLECNYSLGMVGWIQGSQEQIDRYFKNGEQLDEIKNQVYIFILADEQKCGSDRYEK